MNTTPAVGAEQSTDAVAPASEIVGGGLLAIFPQLVRRAGIVFVVQVVGAGLAYGVQVVLARLLGVSHYGVYSYVVVWVGFAALIAGVGLPAASIRFLPVYRAQGDWPRIRGFTRAASWTTFATAGGMTLLAFVVVESLHLYGSLSHPSIPLLGSLLVPAFAASMLYTEVARAGHRVDAAFIPPLVARPALIGIGAGLLYLSRGSLSTNAALTVSIIAAYAVVISQYLLTRRLFHGPDGVRETRREMREWFGVGITLLAAGAFAITLIQVDIVIVGAFLGARDAGVYTAASKTASLVSFVIMAVNATATPHFAALWATGRVDELQRLVTKLAGMIFWPSLAISVGVAVLSGPLLSLFGPGFDVAQDSLLILLVGQVINAAAGSVGYLLTMTGHHREATWALGLSAVACIGLAIVGVLTLGLIGAALGSTIGFLFWNGSLYWLVVRKLGIHASVLTTLRRRQD